ncbi:Rpn family recombination-promoting nuclease/putative transposase [Virgibacillus sp. 179-BFC.A HS]|uniref:Rpn family recombination-promoting nuclease/putative transposase n=1 Tax=Tigheibacillus jepli TaxID=3035914 RepID=A0ABU5CKH8_9BACI|nr:Rpn family recombination-promoting nuclease/putative transposase [Virgibacillus sp. 179-BFC.A HS]MDY0406730.1 Rpn family recombination-promoting nuclease/putative transposase [Virgibacillus sp. 179-BFC.A HS]
MTLPGLRTRTSDYSTVIEVKEDRNEYAGKKHENSTGKRTRLLKRIPLNQLMDLKIDYAFKQLFGNEKNKEITVVFLNAILQKTGRNGIKDIAFTNTEINREYLDDKQSRLDLLVITDADERINVEIQFTDQYDMVKRSIYYWSKLYASPFGKGMAYKELRPVIAINILNFDSFEQTERFHTSYHLYEDEDQFKLTNVMEFHFIEMGKLIKDWKEDKLNPWNSILARWLLLLGMVDSRNDKVYDDIYQELEEIAMKDESLRETLKSWEELSMEQEQREAYEGRLKRILDEEAAKREAELNLQAAKREAELNLQEATQKAKQEGKLEGRREGKKEGEQVGKLKEKETIARRLLAKGMEIEFVVEATGLSKGKVIDIQRNMQN